MRTAHYRTLTDLILGAARHMIFGTHAHRFDYALEADSMEYDFDLQKGWLTMQRWRVLQRDYLPAGAVQNFITRAASTHRDPKKAQIMQLLCATRDPSFVNRQHLWGNCMLGWTYRATPRPTMVMHSRVTYITWLGPLDAALAWVLARDIAKEAGIEVEDVRLIWHLDAMKIHPFKSVPFCHEWGLLDEVYDAPKGTMAKRIAREDERLHRQWKEGYPLENIKFGQFHRMSVRYRQVMDGTPFPSHPIHTLSILEDRL